MKLDLQQDALKIRKFIKQRIADYPKYENLGPGKDDDPIALISVGYYVEQTGYVALVFDTRPDADNDGEWTLHIENDSNNLSFPKWCQAVEELCEGGEVTVTLPGGKSRTLDDSEDSESLAKLFGEIIRDTMLALRDEGAFNNLPLALDAFFIIEEFDGNWGWPDYERRKRLGRLMSNS